MDWWLSEMFSIMIFSLSPSSQMRVEKESLVKKSSWSGMGLLIQVDILS